ncbi:methyltransferase domain-containing protein, partial [candidate division WOR-3 bacterium]|nr:methyltransferase domain-containing protein [candidate division WOR-3 bacterium]
MREITKGWQDFWAEFFRIKYQHLDEPAIEKEVVSHIIHTLNLRRGNRILDLACGEGSKTLELARRGMNVVGVDIAKVLVDYGNKAAQKGNLPVKLTKGDMRDARFNEEFDACTVVSSFGLFDDSGNLKVLQAVEKALKYGGKFYIDLLNPFTRIKEREERWEEVEDGYLLMKYNHNLVTGKMRIISLYITKEGNLIKSKHDELVRLYTLPEMIKLIETAKLVFKGAY